MNEWSTTTPTGPGLYLYSTHPGQITWVNLVEHDGGLVDRYAPYRLGAGAYRKLDDIEPGGFWLHVPEPPHPKEVKGDE